jgi:hypothetical protein
VTADKNPLEDAVDQVLDAFVYAPIGFLFDGPARFPKLVRNGRSQVNNARMLGPFAVQQARSQVAKRTADLDSPVLDLLRGLGVVPGAPTVPAAGGPATAPAEQTSAKRTAAKKATAKPATAKKAAGKPATAKKAAGKPATASERTAAEEAVQARTAAVDAATPSVDVLPIPDYDSLSASQVVSRLDGLAAGQLDAIRAYESATRGRKTVLNRVQQLSKP